MASHLPSPPSSPSPIPESIAKPAFEPPSQDPNDVQDPLSQHLDALLASYLELLDTYTQLRAQLSQGFSSGFLSLAQANRNSTLGPGRRYGEEGYDERMKALRTVSIEQRGSTSTSSRGTLEGTDQSGGDEDTFQGSSAEGEGPKRQSQNQLPTKSTLSEPRAAITKQKQDDQGTQNDPLLPQDPSNPNPLHGVSQPSHCYTYGTTTSPTPSKDPLKWYGILVPPSLRQCQTNFHNAVTSTIPDILTTGSAMQSLEAQIWHVRREMGILDSYEDATGVGGDEKAPKLEQEEHLSLSSLSLGDGDETALRRPSSISKPSPTKKSSLLAPSASPSSKTSELRSRVLKLD